MKKKIILILLVSISMLTYSQKFWGNDSYGILTAETKIGKMENVITGVSRRKLTSSEAIKITLKQKWKNKIKNIRIEALPTRDHVDFLIKSVGKVYDFRYYVNGREVIVGDVIEFPSNSDKIELKMLATYAGYQWFFPPGTKNNKVYTDSLGRIKLKYDVPYYGEKNRTIDVSYLYYETYIIPKVRVNVNGKMDFGQVVAGDSSTASVDVDVYFYNDKNIYEIPDSMNIKNSSGDSLQVNLSDYVSYYNTWDSHTRIKIYGDVDTKRNTPSGKYKGSFYVKFRFK